MIKSREKYYRKRVHKLKLFTKRAVALLLAVLFIFPANTFAFAQEIENAQSTSLAAPVEETPTEISAETSASSVVTAEDKAQPSEEETDTAEATLAVLSAAAPLATGAAELSAQVNWNDNNESTLRPATADYIAGNAALEFSLDGGNTWTQLDDTTMAQLGLAALPVPTVDNTTSFNYWTLKYENLPDSINDGVTTTAVKYQFKQTNVPSGYAKTDDGTNANVVTNTKIKTQQFNKIWNDAGNLGARPSTDAWKTDKVKVYQYLEGNTPDPTKDTQMQTSLSVDEKNEGEWTLNVADLPQYDANGIPYIYYVAEDANVSQDADDKYIAKYENVGNFASNTSYLFENGTLTNTIEGKTQFAGTKLWADGDSAWQDRPNVTFYLYRFPEGDGDYSTASPVQGFDSYALVNADNGTDHNSHKHARHNKA